MSRNSGRMTRNSGHTCPFACIWTEFVISARQWSPSSTSSRSMSMEDRQPAAAASGVRGPLHGEPPVDETFKCLCERCKVSAQANGALFLCSWNRKALGKQACGLFSFFSRVRFGTHDCSRACVVRVVLNFLNVLNFPVSGTLGQNNPSNGANRGGCASIAAACAGRASGRSITVFSRVRRRTRRSNHAGTSRSRQLARPTRPFTALLTRPPLLPLLTRPPVPSPLIVRTTSSRISRFR